MSVRSSTMGSLADAQISTTARHQLQQYLARLPSGSSSGTSSSDTSTLLRRSESLACRVDALHAQLSGNSNSSDDPQLFWSTLTLSANLREVAAQLQGVSASTGDRKATEAALARTQQDVATVESLLSVLSVSSHQAEAGGAFTAPVSAQPAVAASATRGSAGARSGYEYWKQKTLSTLDADDMDALSSSSLDDNDDTPSEADSVLTDPDIHLPNPSAATKLAGITPDPPATDDDWSEYDRAPRTQPPPATTATTASDTILQSDRATHEALSSELLRMASVLKSNSLAFADSLERDRLLLEKAGTDLGQNLDLMTRTRGRLGVYSKKARSMGWFTLSAILVVIVSWMLMFLLIRLT
ncbi:conserved hypothetical protein [Sporisorium reilianum SRZ2]|uniref:t-SNARE coiled-coil homology domain-containing protein n=1 Tax=Sporisorium reilianum (strain SRZ2) TaxID=999809 RepID=E6ZVZ8_SPORE|nr:conserved hypothetical protein [Sporisorium reilianum SRZ2]